MSTNRLTELLRPLVEDLGYEFVGLEHSNNPKNSILRIYIDNKDGIDLSDCTRVSREVAALMDVEDPIPGHYNLEISSPGLDRPLFTVEQYQQFAGEEVKITLFAAVDGRRKFQGRILGCKDRLVMLDLGDAEIALDFGNIAKARLVPDFDGLVARRKNRPDQAG